MRHILLIISGSIAAYKGLELIRRGRDRGYRFTPVLTAGAQQFITPLAAASLAGSPCYTDLFSLKDEVEMGHIRLSREADAVLIAPASANLLAKMAAGQADDLATTILLATDKPVFAAPGMNHKMWEHPATQRNLQRLIADGVTIIQPEAGALACGEVGTGRMAEVPAILDFLDAHATRGQPLAGKRALVTAGPTYEPLDPVRFIGNRSSGKQGFAVADALAAAGANVTLISGPVALPTPAGVTRIDVETAEQMWRAVEAALPADLAVCAAAVADWRPEQIQQQKMKKSGSPPLLQLQENPDILNLLGHHPQRPGLLIGFAAETGDPEAPARDKLARKGCDLIVANDVSRDVFGSEENEALFVSRNGVERFPRMRKRAVAEALVDRIVKW